MIEKCAHKYLTAYEPEISEKAKETIRKLVVPSMTSSDGDTHVYHLEACLILLALAEDFEEDLKILRELEVEFIEF